MREVEFTSAFDCGSNPRSDGLSRSTKAYPAGFRGQVTDSCADQAIAAGAAKEVEPPPAPGKAPRVTKHENLRG